MAFLLKNIVPWGRNMYEYINMFSLIKDELSSRIVSFGDGPASFNFEMTKLGRTVTSLDPIYCFTKAELTQRINEAIDEVIEQTHINSENFTWKSISSIEDLKETRTQSMQLFLSDFEIGKKENRYITHTLPEKTNFINYEFDLGLSSHFLFLYSQLGLDFHIKSITEMLRICKEIRIFPLIDLNIKPTYFLNDTINHFRKNYNVNIVPVDYEFQKNGNKMMVIKHIL